MVGRKYFCTISCSRDSGFIRLALSRVELSASRRSAFEAKPTTHPSIENVLNLTSVGLQALLPWCSNKGQHNFIFILNGLLINIYQQIKLFVYLFNFSTKKRLEFKVIQQCNRMGIQYWIQHTARSVRTNHLSRMFLLQISNFTR